MNDSRLIENYDINSSADSNGNQAKFESEKVLKKSASDVAVTDNQPSTNGHSDMNQLSKSLGATDLNYASEDDEEPYSDAQAEMPGDLDPLKNVFVSAAVSINYPSCPPSPKYIRGDNIVSAWAMRPVEEQPDSSIFEWLLCIDLKGQLPKYILNTVGCCCLPLYWLLIVLIFFF